MDQDRDSLTGTQAWMQRLATTPLDAPPLPDPQIVLWKAHALRRIDQQQQLTKPLNRVERLLLGEGVVAAIGLLIWLAATAPEVWRVPWLLMVIVAGCSLLGAAVALTLSNRADMAAIE